MPHGLEATRALVYEIPVTPASIGKDASRKESGRRGPEPFRHRQPNWIKPHWTLGMTTLRLPRALRRTRLVMTVAIVSLVLLAAYVMFLNHEERVMGEYYRNLRKTNVELYLSKIMQARGFRKFLEEYVATHDYTRPIEAAPSFLVGRWALFDKAKRVSDDFIPDACISGLEIEDGQLKLFGEKDARYAAYYTMVGNTVTAHLNGAETASIDVIGYGSHLHHIEVKLPGAETPKYGYMCR